MPSCTVRREGSILALQSPHFTLSLETTDALRGLHWHNAITGRTVALHAGDECAVTLDAAEQRITIGGWKATYSTVTEGTPNDDAGYLAGYADPGFDDTSWYGVQTAALPHNPWLHATLSQSGWSWARTHVFLPPDGEGKDVTIVLGGNGIMDVHYLRLFVNGQEIGVRETRDRWHEPGVFIVTLGDTTYQAFRFGQDNVLAVQVCGTNRRTAELDAIDPDGGKNLTSASLWARQFEQYVTIGAPQHPVTLTVTDVRVLAQGERGEVAVDLMSTTGELAACLTYRWAADDPVLRKQVRFTNTGMERLRLLDVTLADYATESDVSDGEQGFPVYLDNENFFGVAHPAGWAKGMRGRVRLEQYPGICLAPGAAFDSMDAVYGVAAAGQARVAFRDHIQSRMRRVQAGHDRAYAIYEPFGGEPGENFFQSETYIEQILDAVTAGDREAGCHFDYCSIEFWVDVRGDLQRCDPVRFPQQLAGVKRQLATMGTELALWIDSTHSIWTIGHNPVVGDCFTHDSAYFPTTGGALCRASEPIRTMYEQAFRHHIRDNAVRLLKFDNFQAICYHPHHDHLPGIYSTEAIMNSFIDFLHALQDECPDVFLMLYWGFRSPWWLLHADTLFESKGLHMEAASPGHKPALYVRDAVTIGLDQGHWLSIQEIPPLGKDSLGVWLSNWGNWNSGIGAERWQEGFIMDMCRGSLLAQPWSDATWLDPDGRRQMADFIHLLKAHPACFSNPRFIFGDPWHYEPYGYCCTDGERAFLAINNWAWQDTVVDLQLNSAWGLPDGGQWCLYRWYPEPAHLTGERDSWGEQAAIALRPFEVVLLEVVPAGVPASLGCDFPCQPIVRQFAETSRPVAITLAPAELSSAQSLPVEIDPPDWLLPLPPKRAVTLTAAAPAGAPDGTLYLALEFAKDGAPYMPWNLGSYVVAQGTMDGESIPLTPVIHTGSYPAGWQGWRIAVPRGQGTREINLACTVMMPDEVVVSGLGYWIPGTGSQSAQEQTCQATDAHQGGVA